jgi:hypothetical protein
MSDEANPAIRLGGRYYRSLLERRANDEGEKAGRPDHLTLSISTYVRPIHSSVHIKSLKSLGDLKSAAAWFLHSILDGIAARQLTGGVVGIARNFSHDNTVGMFLPTPGRLTEFQQSGIECTIPDGALAAGLAGCLLC